MNVAPMRDADYQNYQYAIIDLENDPEFPDANAPQPRKFTFERTAGMRGFREPVDCSNQAATIGLSNLRERLSGALLDLDRVKHA